MNLPTMTCTSADHNPNMPDSSNMDHWKCTLRYQGRRMSIIFSRGSGHNGAEPDVRDVLSCLVMESWSADMPCHQFCSELGYDDDSIKARHMWNGSRSIHKRLHNLLGSDYDAIAAAVADE